AAGLIDEEDLPRTGKLDHFADAFNPSTGTIDVLGILPNADNLLRPGMFVRLKVTMGPPRTVLEVPAEAVNKQENGQTFVWVINDQKKAELRFVRLGALDDRGRMRIIESGLTLQDKVLLEPSRGPASEPAIPPP